ncbi:alpha/beta-hydrolase [Pluteus cervinus]|uniref:Alpha/beta-hydrolase n=1 Tax=Pluteus cervinus TaxID=181527 RepID=A0ACD3AD89_9AGAR|nr:alpha/beta-hydrolase [Pluteus cervinus]
MNPADPESFNHRVEKLSTGRTYHFVDQIPNDYNTERTPTLLCVHGFPDLWYGWRHQIGPWVREGFRVIVPDMLGYGGTDKPFDASEYSTKKLCADLAAILDLINVKRAILIGHDWGSYTVGRFALWHPDRLTALIMLSVVYTPPSPKFHSMEDVVKLAPNLGYQLYFSSQRSTADIEANLPKFLSFIYRQPPSTSAPSITSLGSFQTLLENADIGLQPNILAAQEMEYYLQEFKKGMNGSLNYYRTSKFRFDEEKAAGLPSKLRDDLPVLFIWGTDDPTVVPAAISKSHKFIARYQDIALQGQRHWLMHEAKDEVAEKISTWIKASTGFGLSSKL